MPNQEAVIPAKHKTEDVCGCPGGSACPHEGRIEPIAERVGFILCTLGKEKLCERCVRTLGAAFQCHGSHHSED